MSQNTLDELARLILRLVLGVLILLHGWAKIRSGIGGIEAMLAMKGLPGFFAWGVYVGEVLAPILLIAGIWSRMAAALIAINMLVAVFLAHMGHLGQFTSSAVGSLNFRPCSSWRRWPHDARRGPIRWPGAATMELTAATWP